MSHFLYLSYRITGYHRYIIKRKIVRLSNINELILLVQARRRHTLLVESLVYNHLTTAEPRMDFSLISSSSSDKLCNENRTAHLFDVS